MSTSVDPAFKHLSRHQTCFLIWRIENFQPVPVPVDQYGTFYDGDSYIVLSGEAKGQPTGVLTKSKEVRGGTIEHKIHYWLGESTTQDESGTAALKTVELDDHLGGAPQQIREVQDHETKRFLGYFKAKGGIKYVKGGAASGFTHVEHTFKPRLLHVKGKHTPRIKEVDIGWDKMNDGDAFLLDVGKAIYVWNGLSSSLTEKRKALEYARRIRDDRGSGNLIVVNQNEETTDMTAEELEVFEEYLPLKHKNVLKPASAAGADDAYERKAAANLKLWKVAEEGSSLKVTEISSKPLKKEMLDTNDCFIVDNGEAGIWVWTGKKASPKERRESMANAMAFIKQRNYPSHVPVIKVPESGEPAEFKALFKQWDPLRTPGQMKAYSNNRIAKMSQQTKFDAASLHANPATAARARMPDDGSGTKKIWRVERKGNTYDLVELEEKYYGQLYGGDSYVVLYTYQVNKREHYIVYYWLGRKSTTDEKGVAAKKTVEIDDSLGGAAQQIRVTHSKEPPHFMAMFNGRLVIFSGGKAGWGQSSDEGPGDTYLLQVRGTSVLNCKAEQVPLRAESLNSNDVFVLFSKSSVFVWAGKGCTGDEREMAKQIASRSSRGYAMIIEGQEKDDFWSVLGGRAEYSSDPVLRDDEIGDDFMPRLFQCSNATGAFCVNEIVDFVQEDLVPDDVFILDTGHTVYVWVGDDARPEEKTMAIDTGLDYIQTDPSGYRDPDTPITLIKQGYEPPNFTGFFGVWDRDMWSGGKSYDQLKQELGSKNVSMTQIKQKQGGSASFSDVAKFPLEQLQENKGLPDSIDALHKEKYLSDADFKKAFGMSYADFVARPLWKQQRMKKDLRLF